MDNNTDRIDAATKTMILGWLNGDRSAESVDRTARFLGPLIHCPRKVAHDFVVQALEVK